MNNTTYSAKSNDIKRQWYIIDASGKPLGRIAAEAAKLLRGKHKPTFTPNVDTGDHVIILNNCSYSIMVISLIKWPQFPSFSTMKRT